MIESPGDPLRAFVAQALQMEVAAIEECAERILLSGTNWGIRVWRWIDGDKVIVVAEPTPEIHWIEFRDGPAPADLPRWRVCPNPDCHAGWVDTITAGWALIGQPCPICEGRGWVTS